MEHAVVFCTYWNMLPVVLFVHFVGQIDKILIDDGRWISYFDNTANWLDGTLSVAISEQAQCIVQCPLVIENENEMCSYRRRWWWPCARRPDRRRRSSSSTFSRCCECKAMRAEPGKDKVICEAVDQINSNRVRTMNLQWTAMTWTGKKWMRLLAIIFFLWCTCATIVRWCRASRTLPLRLGFQTSQRVRGGERARKRQLKADRETDSDKESEKQVSRVIPVAMKAQLNVS